MLLLEHSDSVPQKFVIASDFASVLLEFEVVNILVTNTDARDLVATRYRFSFCHLNFLK